MVFVEGSDLAVKMSSGDIRHFSIPAGQMATIDGAEMPLRNVKPGTKLNATVTTSGVPVTQRTVTMVSGKVWYAAPPTVIVTMPDGTNKMYKAKNSPDAKFMVNGKPATVFELRKGMNVQAERVTEEPMVQVSRDARVTGSAPPAPTTVASAVPSTPAPVAAAPAPRPAPAPAPAPVARAAEPTPAKLPKTGSPIPAMGLLGGLLTAAGLALRYARRS